MNAVWKIIQTPDKSEMPSKFRRIEPDQYDRATFVAMDDAFAQVRCTQWRMILLDRPDHGAEYYTATPEPRHTMLGALISMARVLYDGQGIVSATLFENGVPLQSCTAGVRKRPDGRWFITICNGSLEREKPEQPAAAAA